MHVLKHAVILYNGDGPHSQAYPVFFFCSSVSVDDNTQIRVLLSTETKEQKNRGRPGNEARDYYQSSQSLTLYEPCNTYSLHEQSE